MSDKIELIKERDRLFIKSQHLGQDKEKLVKDNEVLVKELSIMDKAHYRCSQRGLVLIEENAALKKENENLSMSIKGMASGKANLDKSYQELEGLYGRLEKENAELVKRWDDLEEWVKFYKGTGSGNEFYRGTIKCKMKELQAGSQ